MRWLLALCGVACVGFYGYSLANQHIYQSYENWAFDQQIAGRTVSFTDWLRERTPLGTYMTRASSTTATAVKPAKPTETPRGTPLAEGTVVGKVLIPRLHLSAIVLQGVEDDTLARGAGHVPSTAMPGQSGNFAIAAHRDTLFRPLRNIQKNDDVTFQSATGSYTYQVFSTQIVLPSDVGVLRPPPDGGKWLTLITCYPFYYIGSAPKRFIVQAKLVSADPDSKLTARTDSGSSPPPQSVPVEKKPKLRKQASVHKPRQMRGSFAFTERTQKGFRRSDRVQTAVPETVSTIRPKKKRAFWRRLASIL
jgi:sortase A